VIVAASVSAHAAPVEKLSAKVPAAQLRLFALSYRSDKGTVAEVRLNDVPVVSFKGEGTSGSSNEVQFWLQPGTNRFDVDLKKAPGTDEVLRLTLHGLAGEGFPDESNAIVQVSVPAKTAPGARAYTFELPEKQAPPGLLWKKAAVIASLTDADKKALRELAVSLLAAAQKGDAVALRKLMQFTMEERARTTYSDPKQLDVMIDEAAKGMKVAFAKAALAPTLDYRLVGGGRIVLVTANGKPPIASRGDDGESALDVSAAKIDGRWTLVP
jgi:hypothetical protein